MRIAHHSMAKTFGTRELVSFMRLTLEDICNNFIKTTSCVQIVMHFLLCLYLNYHRALHLLGHVGETLSSNALPVRSKQFWYLKCSFHTPLFSACVLKRDRIVVEGLLCWTMLLKIEQSLAETPIDCASLWGLCSIVLASFKVVERGGRQIQHWAAVDQHQQHISPMCANQVRSRWLHKLFPTIWTRTGC